MAPSQKSCPTRGLYTHARFLPSPQPKSRKNAHMTRFLRKLFFAKNQPLGRILALGLSNMNEKG